MKIFIIALIIACLLQTSFVPVNLCMILLICRSLARPDISNLYLAFFAGIFLGILSSLNIGFYALAFLAVVEMIELLRNTRITSNILWVLPISGGLFLLLALAERLFLGMAINFWIILAETVLSLPFFVVVKFWEERFIVLPDVKLKL